MFTKKQIKLIHSLAENEFYKLKKAFTKKELTALMKKTEEDYKEPWFTT